ncbi:MAG: hypothetical protein U5R06_22860 [candidate division KSB1 bacterium]|nr:hypothetical protein [candidate division KSB1 bacterium]
MYFRIALMIEFLLALTLQVTAETPLLKLNDKEYFDSPAFDVMVFSNQYPEGHQGGIEFIHHGKRTTTNGNLMLQPTPGQWQPQPKVIDQKVDRENNTIVVSLQYPDSSRHKTGFNPMVYPDWMMTYQIHVTSLRDGIRIRLDLEEPLPEEWDRRVGFNIELFPGDLFGKTWYLDEKSGAFPRYANTPAHKDAEGEFERHSDCKRP